MDPRTRNSALPKTKRFELNTTSVYQQDHNYSPYIQKRVKISFSYELNYPYFLA